MFTDDDRRLLNLLNSNLTWTRDQLAAGIGVDRNAAPPTLTPAEVQERTVARRVDVGFALDQIMARLAALEAAVAAALPTVKGS